MDGTSLRIAVGGLIGIAALCVVGVVTVSALGKDGSALVALASLAGTCLGILGTLLLPSGRMPDAQPGPTTGNFQTPPPRPPH